MATRSRILQTILGLLSVLCLILVIYSNTYIEETKTTKTSLEGVRSTTYSKRKHDQTYLVHWYDLLGFLEKRPDAVASDFSVCHYSNCRMSFDQNDAYRSDAVIFNGKRVSHELTFKRPSGQIWIFSDNESPISIKRSAYRIKKVDGSYQYGIVTTWRSAFNWTMFYDKELADIYLPYGELRKHNTYISRDYDKIAATKTKGALIITSDCHTPSKRMEYINKLKKYTEVDVLGRCGTTWDCGRPLYHDDCFDILNQTYSFYLAFENAFCQQYFTEKLFENYKYDTLIVTRGGNYSEANRMFPKGSVISTDDFKDPKKLGEYLNMLRRDKQKYAQRLAEKSQYYITTYKESYQHALCDLCRRLNHQDAYHKTIPDIIELFHPKKYCLSV